MKIFITGHTSGIGKSLFELLAIDHEVSGGSRSTGWDVSDSNNYADVYDYDVLVNNAYHRSGQLELLRDVYQHWQGQKKTIINVGSAHKDYQINRPLSRLDYNVSKKALEAYSFWISDNDRVCRSMMYNPGVVDTPLARSSFADWSKSDQQRALSQLMNVEDCAKAIKMMITSAGTFKQVTHI